MGNMFLKITKWIPAGRVEEISVKDLKIKLFDENADIQILDVRTHLEWKLGHLPNAYNVPIIELAKVSKDLPFDKNKPVVAICLSAHRSIPAVRHLKELGYTNVKQMQGGMKSWNRHYKDLLHKHD